MIRDRALNTIYEKVVASERLTFEDGLKLFTSRDLLGVGYLANIVRERKNENRAYYIFNQHINYSNVCINGCKFCAFGKEKGAPGAYEMSLEEIYLKVKERLDEPITEIHIVGGLHPELPFSYYTDMLQGIKELRPDVHIQAFTVVELVHMAEIYSHSLEETLLELKKAGLGSIPGGGAEVFSSRIRSELCPEKLSPEGWINASKTAHRVGLLTNATMLYGHIENYEERVAHFISLREAQDETGGFITFIPLAFHPHNTHLEHLHGTSGFDDLKMVAVARLMLDNFPHIKSFWIMIGPKMAQLALSFGADDMDGTVIEEKITHMAGAQTAQSLPRDELVRLIREAGREPAERDTLYNRVGSEL
ncbi:MAG: aminofutalosine synthase MqnE [Candidatus Tectomicrobia bacterium]|uniref:Aminodeoxyfutalosine synthase n=1 Tax=Tectimicrobiota bacterium TaxID=2528274 RepID=A0A933LRS1_UNCTE|nr:aminofutalosine synthase MqnE [Candidatus Tectomicrobia bacterium]